MRDINQGKQMVATATPPSCRLLGITCFHHTLYNKMLCYFDCFSGLRTLIPALSFNETSLKTVPL